MVTGLCLLLPATAFATEWTAPVALTGSLDRHGNSFSPQVGVDAAGTATAVWIQNGRLAYTSTRPAGGAWSTPMVIAETSTTSFTELKLSVTPNGRAMAVWIERRDNYWSAVQVVTRSLDGVWSAPEDAQPERDYPKGLTYHFGANLGPSGEVFVSWGRGFVEMVHGEILGGESAAATRSLAGVWGAAESAIGAGVGAAVRIDGQGDALGVSVDDGRVASADRPASGTWSPRATLVEPPEPGTEPRPDGGPDPRAADRVSVSVNRAGDAVVAWQRQVGEEMRIEMIRRPKHGAWGAIETAATAAGGASLELDALDLSADGTATMVFVEQRDAGASQVSRLLASTSASAGSWTTPVELTTPLISNLARFATVSVGVADTGEAIAAWTRAGWVEAALRSSDGTWAPAATLGASPSLPTVFRPTVLPGGDATLYWGDAETVHARSAKAPTSAPTPTPTPSPSAKATPAPIVGGVPAPPTPLPPAKRSRPVRIPIATTLSGARASACPRAATARAGSSTAQLSVRRVTGKRSLRCRATGSIVVKTAANRGTAIRIRVFAPGLRSVLVRTRVP